MILLFSLPRSGSRMLCSMLDSHPQVNCWHEYLVEGQIDEDMAKLSENGKVAVGHCQWNLARKLYGKYPTILLYREDETRGAIGQMMLSIPRAHGEYMLKPDTVKRVARERREHIEEMKQHADLLISYEEITDNKPTRIAPQAVSDKLCDFIGVSRWMLYTDSAKKEPPKLPKNLKDCYGLVQHC